MENHPTEHILINDLLCWCEPEALYFGKEINGQEIIVFFHSLLNGERHSFIKNLENQRQLLWRETSWESPNTT